LKLFKIIMDYSKPLPRSAYSKRSAELNGTCAFCGEIQKELLLESFLYWTWQFSLFPYYRQHTLLIPKRHCIKFEDLTDEEVVELKTIMKEVEKRYRESGIVDKDLPERNQLFIGWRSRAEVASRPEVAHLHLHIYPDFEGSEEGNLDPEAHLEDINKLRKGS